MSLRLISTPIADVRPVDLVNPEGSGLIPLGFVPQNDGTVVVRWASPIDNDNPEETLTVSKGAQYPGHIDRFVSSDVDLLIYFGSREQIIPPMGGGASAPSAPEAPSYVRGVDAGVDERLATFAEQEAQTTAAEALLAATRTVRGLELYLDGGLWKVAQYASNGTTQIASANLGSVAVGASSQVALPLDLEALFGSPAIEIRCHGAGVIKVVYTEAKDDDFPVTGVTVKADEVKTGRFSSIVSIDAAIARIHISWGG